MDNFDSWYEEKLRLIYGAMGKLRVRMNKEEYYQVGLIALWEASQRFDPGKGEFDSYAYSYIYNRMKNALTKETSYQNRVQSFEPNLLGVTGRVESVEDVVSGLMFDYYLEQLTPGEREVIRLRFLKDYSVSETAAELKISIHAVKNRTREAVKRLRLKLLEGGDGNACFMDHR